MDQKGESKDETNEQLATKKNVMPSKRKVLTIVEVYGFVIWMVTLIVMIWMILFKDTLINISTWMMATVLFILLITQSIDNIINHDPDSYYTLQDKFTTLISAKDQIPPQDEDPNVDQIPPLSDIPITVVNKVLYSRKDF